MRHRRRAVARAVAAAAGGVQDEERAHRGVAAHAAPDARPHRPVAGRAAQLRARPGVAMASRELIQALAVTAELLDKTMSEAAARLLVADLAGYPEAAILAALVRCRQELKSGQFTVAAI